MEIRKGVPRMTTLSTFTINGTSVLGTIINFEIQKKLFYPFNFKGKFVTSGLKNKLTVAINHTLVVKYTDSVGGYDVFIGRVTKISPQGNFTTIEATHGFILAFNYYTTKIWSSATYHNDIMEDMLDTTAGPGLTVIDSVSNPQSISYYNSNNASVIDELRKLSLFSAPGASDKLTVIRSDASAVDTVIIEDYGESVPATDITLSHANSTLLSKVTYEDTSQEIANMVIMSCRYGVESRLITDVIAGSASLTTYGSRTLKCYRPEIRSQTDARKGTDTILRQYSEKRTRLKVDVKHSALHGNGTHYPVVNTPYTIVDAITGTTYSDVVCTEQTLRWPSFKDTCIFGQMFVSTGDYFLSNEGNSSYVENNSAMFVTSSAYRSGSAQTGIVYPYGATIVFNTENWDMCSNYNNGTGVFTAPCSGYYTVMYQLTCSSIDTAMTVYAGVSVNGVLKINQSYTNKTGSIVNGVRVSGTGMLYLDVDDEVSVYAVPDSESGGNFQVDYGASLTMFSIQYTGRT